MPQSQAKSKVLLVEGKDEVYFFNALLKEMGIKQIIDVQEVGGKDKFKNEIQAFLQSFGSQVKSYAIIRDADTDSNAAFQSVVAILKNNREPFPTNKGDYGENANRRVGVFIMPGNQAERMLEDLCLQTVADHPVINCVEGYISCLQKTLVTLLPDQPKEPDIHYFPKNSSKARAQAFLAGMHEIASSVGIAAEKKYWNFDHAVLADLKAFLQKL